MSHAHAASEPGDRLLHVSRAQFVGSLAASLVLFLFAAGPLWRHPEDIGKLDVAVWWSYGAIPLLIGGCLVASHRFTLRGLLLDTMALTLLKYVVTCSIAIACWALIAAPRAATAAARQHPAPPTHEAALVPTKVDPGRTGTVLADVVGPDDRPIANATVWIAAGLEDATFAPPAEPLVLEHGPLGVRPALAVARVGQRVEARSSDGRMHTLVASTGNDVVFNVPLLSSGAPTPIHLDQPEGLVTLHCNVHPDEPTSRLLVLSHPFVARTDADGQARLSSVPSGRLRIGAAHGDHAYGEAVVDLDPAKAVAVRVVLTP